MSDKRKPLIVGRMKPILVGEQNPYGGDDYYALYPAPDGCAGHRLCCLILGMHSAEYLDAFERVNLVRGKWSAPTARDAARQLVAERMVQGRPSPRFILLGSKVAAAFGAHLPGCEFHPYRTYLGGDGAWAPHYAILPHPSGLCRMWNEPQAFAKARAAVAALAPEVAPLIGKATP